VPRSSSSRSPQAASATSARSPTPSTGEIGGVFGGGSRHPRGDEHTYFSGDGRALRTVFEKVGGEVVDDCLERTGLGWDDFRHVLVHQVTVPYVERFLEVTGCPEGKLVRTVETLGNLASASLGVQLARCTPGSLRESGCCSSVWAAA
jgi:3-oxoacyl-[acyl-carrier-protein] synthase-3